MIQMIFNGNIKLFPAAIIAAAFVGTIKKKVIRLAYWLISAEIEAYCVNGENDPRVVKNAENDVIRESHSRVAQSAVNFSRC